jgi:hypothetical protein
MEVKWGGLNIGSKRIASMHFLSSFDTFLVKSLRFFLETLSLTVSREPPPAAAFAMGINHIIDMKYFLL